MANPKLPNLSSLECAVIYSRLEDYNRARASFKKEGAYLIVLPYGSHSRYTLWIASPKLERQKYFPIGELAESIDESLRMASTWFYYSNLPLHIVEYNEKHMAGMGDDILSFGRYRGHMLSEIRYIDPRYLWWLAYKYTPNHPKAFRLQKIAELYNNVNQDLSRWKMRNRRPVGHEQPAADKGEFLGKVGDRLTDLHLKVISVVLEDDPYKTHYDENGKPLFCVIQRLLLVDPDGRKAQVRIRPRYVSRHSLKLAAFEHAYRIGDELRIKSAKVAQCIERKSERITRLNYVSLNR